MNIKRADFLFIANIEAIIHIHSRDEKKFPSLHPDGAYSSAPDGLQLDSYLFCSVYNSQSRYKDPSQNTNNGLKLRVIFLLPQSYSEQWLSASSGLI